MTFETEQTPTPSKLMHATINNLSTIISIAQFNILSEAMSPKLQEELKRIIQTAREASTNLKALAEILQEDE
jgi:hypothetical protein